MLAISHNLTIFQIKPQIELQRIKSNLYVSNWIAKMVYIMIYISIAIGICPSMIAIKAMAVYIQDRILFNSTLAENTWGHLTS